MGQRDDVRASLLANHDHGTYARRKGPGRRAEDQPGRPDALDAAHARLGISPEPFEPRSDVVMVDRDRLERVERLLAGVMEAPTMTSVAAADDGEVAQALAEVRSLLGGDHAG